MKFLYILPFVLNTAVLHASSQCKNHLNALNTAAAAPAPKKPAAAHLSLADFADILKEAGISPPQRRQFIAPDAYELLKRAKTEFQEALQKIRRFSLESLLRELGFPFSYYSGVDKAVEFNTVTKYLQKIKAGLKHTHISYFADQAPKTIADFERSFRIYNQNRPGFLEERLRLLEALKKEARKRIEDRSVTYDWWVSFNLRLPLITLEPSFVRKFLEAVNINKIENIYDSPEGVQELFSDAVRSIHLRDVHDDIRSEIHGIQRLIRKKENFPEEILFFTTDKIGIMAFNILDDYSYFVGVLGAPQAADGKRIDPFSFFTHDLGHASLMNPITRGFLERINNISSTSDREKAELALFIYRHENGSFSFSQRLQHYYEDAEAKANLSQSELRRITAATKTSARKMMKSVRYRFFYPDDLQGMLPDSVNINTKKEVIRFLNESADVFADILLAH